jgi:glutamate---cysteine ligase / carboxylate-amine ligase
MSLIFHPSERLSIGVEIELQLIDPKTKDLEPAVPQIMAELGGEDANIKPEAFPSMIEINTGICNDVNDARRDLGSGLRRLREICDTLGVELASAGTHPFALYNDKRIYPLKRYQNVLDRNVWLAQRLLIFGLHVHVGMRSGEHAVAMTNGLLPYLPHLLALSASSPYWQGIDTGLASARIAIFESLSTAGHPCLFQSWEEFEKIFQAMVASAAIKSLKDIWWDIRPHPDFGTVEVRISDALPTLSQTLGVVALVHCLCADLNEQYEGGKHFVPPPYWIVRENKWRASRWGMKADLIVDEMGRTRPVRSELQMLFKRLENQFKKLNGESELRTLCKMIDTPSSYERQRQGFARTKHLQDVVDILVDELKTDTPHY